jgi:hypothetical protein
MEKWQYGTYMHGYYGIGWDGLGWEKDFVGYEEMI